jgi:hypothetical protein
MYQLVKARHRLDRRAGRWLDADLANEPVTTLATRFGDVWLYITYPSLTEVKALRFDKVTNWLGGVDPLMTVQGWLTSLGNKTLPFEGTLPNTEIRLVKYAQAWHCGYDATPIGRFGHVESGGSKFDKEDLLLTHPNFDPAYIAHNAMFTVNGYFHLADHTEAGVRVVDGNRSIRVKNDNQIGVYSFEKVGAIQYVPITAEMISAQTSQARLYDGVYITMPETIDFTNKSVLLSLGGHLHVLDRAYTRVADRTWRVNLNQVMFLERWFQARTALDLSSLGIEEYEANPSLITLEQLKEDSVIQGYLTLSQSFFILVDCESFFQQLDPLEYSGLPGRFYAGQADGLPVLGTYGRMLDYHTIREENTFVYCADENIRYNYDAGTRRWDRFKAVDAGCYPAQPFRHAEAYLRLMGTEN